MAIRNQTTFRTIPLTRIINQLNQPTTRIAVYDFGSVEKYELEDRPGQIYAWARGIRPLNN